MNHHKLLFLTLCLIGISTNSHAEQVEYGKNYILKTNQIIHENRVSNIDTNKQLKTNEITRVTKAVEEKKTTINTVNPHEINIHENSLKIANFIVHENVTRSKYTKGIDKIKTPNKAKLWTAAASQATLLFNPTAEERDQAINILVNNGGWFKVSKKLLSSDNEKIRINGMQMIKSALEHPKYNNVKQSLKVKKIVPILLQTLNDDNSKIRFLSALIMNNLLDNSFNYKYSSEEQQRINSIALLTDYYQTNY